MRKKNVFALALIGTLLLVLLFIAARFLYIGHHTQTLEKIAGKEAILSVQLYENKTALRTTEDSAQIAALTELLDSYTYTEYPHFFKPDKSRLSANRLTVQFENGHSIGVNADGYVFVNDKLRDVEGSRGQEFYHKLYVLFYPNAA